MNAGITDDELRLRYEAVRIVARNAGARALDYFRNRAKLQIEMKGPQDFVSHADRDVEHLIRGELATAFPGDAFLGEETAADFTGPVERCWIVDPIDGTHNFLRGVPYWNVSIGFAAGGRTRLGAVYDPVADELFHVREGHGAWCTSMIGETALHATRCATLRGAYIVLGHHDRHPEPVYLRIRERMMAEGIAMRNFGAAALQLAHVASGRVDAFVEMELSAWDAAAGMLLVTEAGGRCAPFAPATPTAKDQCIASASGIADALTLMVSAAQKASG